MAAAALRFLSPSLSYSHSSRSPTLLSSRFLGFRNMGFVRNGSFRVVPGPSSGSRAKCWFKFGNRGADAEDAGIYGSQKRDDFDRDDVEYLLNLDIHNKFLPVSSLVQMDRLARKYFNYMGMLAVEGSYDKLEALLQQNIHPVDILLMMAATEGDKPKIEELLRAGASYNVKDSDGKTALDLAADEEIRELILGFSPAQAP